MQDVESNLSAPAENQPEPAPTPETCKDCGDLLDEWNACPRVSASSARLGCSVHTPLYCGRQSNSLPIGGPVRRARASGRELARCCAGVDLPGVGWRHGADCPERTSVVRGSDCAPGEVPAALRNYLDSEPLPNLIAAARALALEQIVDPWLIDASRGWTGCRGCGEPVHLASRPHARGCSVDRVLRLVDLFEEVLLPNPTEEQRKEAAPLLEPPNAVATRARAGVRARGSFGEPWVWTYLQGLDTINIYDDEGTLIVSTDKLDREARDWAERIVASVNFCAWLRTEELIRVARGEKEAML